MRTDQRIVIVGAGYAGLWAAKALTRRRRNGVWLTVINDHDHFVERLRLHQSATRQALSRISLADVFRGTNTEVIIDRVRSIRPAEQTIELGSQTIGYDQMIYALGSGSHPSAGEAEEVATPAGADRLQERLAALTSGTVTVVGGGLTGLETATEIAERRPDLSVRLISATPIDSDLAPAAGRYLRRSLDRAGVRVDEGHEVTATTATSVTCHTEDTPDPITIDTDLVIWTTGYRAHSYAREAGLAVDHHDRIRVDGELRSITDRRICAIGDAAAVPTRTGEPARMSCQTAVPMGYHAGKAMLGSLAGRPSKRHHPRFVWRAISLGRHDGIVQFTRADDRPLPIYLRGRAAARFKEFLCYGVAWTTTGRRPRAIENGAASDGRATEGPADARRRVG